jgi:hypothetical protein
MSSNAGTSNYVYVQSEEYSWVPARVIEWKEKEAVVSIPQYKDEDAIQSDGGKHAKGEVSQTIKLNSYPGKTLPLQNVTEEGMLKEVEDMVDLAFLHEVSWEFCLLLVPLTCSCRLCPLIVLI